MDAVHPRVDRNETVVRPRLVDVVRAYRPVVQAGPHYLTPCWMAPQVKHNVIIRPVAGGEDVWVCHHCRTEGNAVQYLQSEQHMTAEQAVHELRSRHAAHARVESPGVHALQPQEQARAVGQFLAFINDVVPESQQRGGDYMRQRGATQAVIVESGPFFGLTAADWSRVGASIPDDVADVWTAAGLLQRQADGRLSPRWSDDCTIGVCRRRDGTPVYLWARRHAVAGGHGAYQYQAQAGGAVWTPFNLPAIRRAMQAGGTLRVVQTPIAAIASACLPTGAAPAIALMTRIGWDRTPPDAVQAFWNAVGPDLARLHQVELVVDRRSEAADEDRALQQARTAEKWLCDRGVPAVVRPVATYGAWRTLADGMEVPSPSSQQADPAPPVEAPSAIPSATQPAAPAVSAADGLWQPSARDQIEAGLIAGMIDAPDRIPAVTAILGTDPHLAFHDAAHRAMVSAILRTDFTGCAPGTVAGWLAVNTTLDGQQDRSSWDAGLKLARCMDYVTDADDLLATARILRRLAGR